jgi:hypothetical protein
VGAGWIRLWRWTAWGGIGLSLYAGWRTVDDIRDRASSERDIKAACAQLVSGAAVMDLRGGMVRAETSEDDRLDVRELPGTSKCAVYKVADSGKTEFLFTLVVQGINSTRPLNWVGDDSEPFYSTDADGGMKSDPTAVADQHPEPHPVGDGTLGWYGNWYTTVRAECGQGSSPRTPELLHITARADYKKVSAADRQRLAHIARSAAAKLADRIGCRTQLRALPDDQLATVPSALHQDASPVESCVLAVSPDQVGRIADGLPDDKRSYARSALTHSPWWLRTASYFGTEARTVGYDDVGSEYEIIRTGTAGHADDIWWASSICNGKPALHTISSSYAYDSVLGSQALSSLFRAYVDDITKRRGCTHVTYPDAKDFRNF